MAVITTALILGLVAFGELVLGAPRHFTATAQLTAGVVAAAVCLAVGRGRTGFPRQWRLFAAAGLVVWTLTRLWWTLGDPPPAVYGLGYLVLPACMLLGLLGAVHTRPRPVPMSPLRDQIALVIDSVLITGSVLALVWSVIPGDPLGDLTGTALLGYVIADLILLTMVVLLLTTRPDSPAGRRPLRLVGVALVAFGTADTIRLLDGGNPWLLDGGMGWLLDGGMSWLENAGYLLGPAFIALAALSPGRPAPVRPAAEPLQRDWFRLLLPYGPVLVTGLVLVAGTVAGSGLTPFEAYLGWLGLALVVTRQMITIVDNTVLFDRVAESQRRLHHQAYHDPLTGLANRALFRERLVLAIDAHHQHGAPVAVLFADLDDFKLINDTFGHAMGDRVLHAIGERMRACVRSQDLVARLGGDEFAVVLDQAPQPAPVPRRRLRSRWGAAARGRRYILSAAGVRVTNAPGPPDQPLGRSVDGRPARAADPVLPHVPSSRRPASHQPNGGPPAVPASSGAPGPSVPSASSGPSASSVPSGLSASSSPSASSGPSVPSAPSGPSVPSAPSGPSASSVPSGPSVPSSPSALSGPSAPSSPSASSGENWAAEAEAIGQRLLAALREPYVIDGRSVGVGVSIGLVAAEPGDRLSADLLLRRADAAMYAVKRRGKGALIRYTGRRDSGPNADLPQLLAGALADGGSPAEAGFEVHYQPIVRLGDSATVAVEALARWTDPVAGPVHPDVFVTMAERTGLVAAIDDFVLDRACADAAVLAERFGRPIDLHVNVSAGRIGQQGLEDAVAAALARHGVPAARLVIEITETLRIPDLPRAAAVVGRLRALGVRVALDDFGSGFNALAQLHAIPVDIVKLDSTLTDVSSTSDRSGALCRSVLSICAELGITVVAEGLETAERSAALEELGCPLGQGYLFGAPAPLAQLGASPTD
ncbi:putative bifunctional diguanylate cyclase/phosphodiesterase [Actinoplanes flavus]|uniref:EAL domain-containing protein n=1 Tax=Actinoplanes flavus TaxID=2820290 RepID=A0ABS3UUW9_9ACTN|nr:EAL domain-containing protein [Actinoplanes flavus]MBO3742393.1 EAL domain-containing protein [Actinoplanes flavus]